MVLGIILLMALACTGAVYGLSVLVRSKPSRTAALIATLEQEYLPTEPAGRAESLLPASWLAAYDQRLLWAGRPHGLDARQFVGLKIASAAALPTLILVGFYTLSSDTLVLMLLGGVAGFAAPDAWLSSLIARVRRQIAGELPLFTDLVAAAVDAGLPLSEAIRQVARDVPGLVAREFLRAVQEMAAGKPRMQAWRDLAARVPGDDFRPIVQAIMQAEQFGTSVAEILRYQVQQMRLVKQQEAQRIAQSTSVKMRIPIMVLELQLLAKGGAAT